MSDWCPSRDGTLAQVSLRVIGQAMDQEEERTCARQGPLGLAGWSEIEIVSPAEFIARLSP